MSDFSIWPATNGPNTDAGDASDISRGITFRLSAPGWLKAIRFYRGTTNIVAPTTGTVVGRLYTLADGLAVSATDVTFTLSGTGWLSATLPVAKPLAANVSYKAAVLSGGYTATGNYWASGAGVGGIVNGIVTAPDAGGNPSGIGPIQQGSFKQPTTGIEFPNQYFSGGNYWVDVVVSDTDPAEDIREVTATATLGFSTTAASDKVSAQAVTATLPFSSSSDDTKVTSSAVTATLPFNSSVVSVPAGAGVPAAVSSVLCSAWATYADVPVDIAAQFPTLTEPVWTDMLMRASELLWALSGRRWYGAGCTETAVLRSSPPQQGNGSWPYHHSWGSCGCWTSVAFPRFTGPYPHAQAPMAVQLPRSPINSIVSVAIGGEVFTEWRFLRNGWLERLDGETWDVCVGDTEVVYLYGEPPPAGGRDAAIELATEFAKQRTGAGDCRLPTRVTSVTRQGVTTDFLSINDFLDKGRTGIPGVDLWLSTVNPKGRPAPAMMWSPDIPSTIRSPQ